MIHIHWMWLPLIGIGVFSFLSWMFTGFDSEPESVMYNIFSGVCAIIAGICIIVSIFLYPILGILWVINHVKIIS